ncbi:hypothetical protein [Nesterenkonia marinintestina]|uniref:hypothetical protein n=1 Tax=Nesterenkonia marinintestina TaxID=2979865 RepID=UPI0021C14925|nr:hypothetical protein [Nesterenkonia sp. GX14115]
MSDYKNKAADTLRFIEAIRVDYDDVDLVEIEADTTDIDFQALTSIISDWVGDPDRDFIYGGYALLGLADAPERLPQEWLLQIAERQPLRLRQVVEYLVAREETDENWELLKKLSHLERLSPWGQLWLLWAADRVGESQLTSRVKFLDWAEKLLKSKFEVARAEAAWLLAGANRLSEKAAAALFVEASDISQTGVAAAVGRRDGATPTAVGKSIQRESQILRSAYEWGRNPIKSSA